MEFKETDSTRCSNPVGSSLARVLFVTFYFDSPRMHLSFALFMSAALTLLTTGTARSVDTIRCDGFETRHADGCKSLRTVESKREQDEDERTWGGVFNRISRGSRARAKEEAAARAAAVQAAETRAKVVADVLAAREKQKAEQIQRILEELDAIVDPKDHVSTIEGLFEKWHQRGIEPQVVFNALAQRNNESWFTKMWKMVGIGYTDYELALAKAQYHPDPVHVPTDPGQISSIKSASDLDSDKV
ncbi:hypothetical protein PsorP6_000639 [Peronosclerospora sorghi]|uniref:Uncharacterized protein n=1 Tax=Peronosclerospora sorghi TaxID=230839 RepID=A0ACC0WSR0_9STRA|nr:hypothetical protein PsorP6_000639 [Peronosclerospora sorghi]